MSASRLAFVIGGAQKSGTTTLDAVLRRHPAIQMAHVKETHVFDDEQRDWSDPHAVDIDRFFPTADRRLRGEATPITLYWRPAIRRLATFNPQLRIVLLLRDPVSRAYANWCKEYAAGLEQLSFSESIREGRRRVVSQAEVEGLHRVFSYVERGLYGAQLEHLLSRFPRANVHCEVFEEFLADPHAALGRITDFLCVAPLDGSAAALPHEHRRQDIAYPSELSKEDVAYLRDVYRDDIALAEELLGRRLDLWRASR